MSASRKASSVARAVQPIQKLGILAGSGELPRLLIEYCHAQSIEPYIVTFDGHTDKETCNGEFIQTRLGASGKVLSWLNQNEVKDLLFIGGIQRPHLWQLWPDWTTFSFLIKSGCALGGDNALLAGVRKELENRNFTLHGFHKFLPETLTPTGVLTKADVLSDDIDIGTQEALKLGEADIGQAVLVKNGQVIGREDRRGTNALIKKHGEEGAVLVKMCKPQQDKDLDLPTTGLKTIQNCIDKKMAGIAVHAGHSLFLNRDEAIALANANNLFIKGISHE